MLNRMAFEASRTPPAVLHPSSPVSIDLLNLAGDNGIYGVGADNPRSRVLKAGLLLKTPFITEKLGLALGEMVAMMALGATEITFPVVSCESRLHHPIIFEIHENTSGPDAIERMPEWAGEPSVIRIQGNSRTLPKVLRKWTGWVFVDSGPESETIDRFRKRVAACGRPLQTGQVCRSGGVKERIAWTGEIDVVKDLAWSIPRGAGSIQGMILLSKPEQTRLSVQMDMEMVLRSLGYDPEIVVLNAYKPGLSWLMEGVLPELTCHSDIARLDIFYQPFIGWEGALELRSRWLQELFPAAELISARLGIDTDHIHFFETPEQPDVYRIQARSSSNEIVMDEGFSPRWFRMMYLEGRLELGYVHPTTGGIRIWQNDRVLLDRSVPTDRERFWETFQNKWLPALFESMRNRRRCQPGRQALAFWDAIRFHVWIEETDVALGIGDERICPMDALHEDIYFVLLAAFAEFRNQAGLSDAMHLGRILPKTFSCYTGDSPAARMTATPLDWPEYLGDEAVVPGPDMKIIGLQLVKKKIRVDMTFSSDSESDEKLNVWAEVLRKRGLDVNVFPGMLGVWMNPPDRKSPEGQAESPQPRRLKMLQADQMLLYSDVKKWVKKWQDVPHLSVWQAADSFQNRSVWAVEAVLAGGGQWVSIPRLRLLKPTLFCNARHHANEISSTTACLIAAGELAVTSAGQDCLRYVNVVFVPMENPDGVCTLEELLIGTGRKIHAARYNAMGAEYYSDYFRDPPRFPEAAAKTRLWKRWLPEIMIDHHGVPIREWDQPFSGYAPTGFAEYWIPRTFVYTHIPFSNSPGHPLHETAQSLATLMREVLTAEPDIVASNQEIARRYDRYARGPQPDVFPPTSSDPLLVYPLSERGQHTNFAVRYPDITRSDIIVEVPDEVASGDMLERCVRAHRKIQEAAILFLQRSRGYAYMERNPDTGTYRLLWQPSSTADKKKED